MLETQRCIGGLEAKIDQVIAAQATASTKLDRVEATIATAIAYVKAGALVLTIILPLLFGLVWWSLGEKLNALRDGMIVAPPPASSQPAPAPRAP